MSNRASPGEGTPGLGTREPGSDPTVTPLQGANEPADSTSIVSSGIPIVNIVKEWIFRSGLKTLSVASTLLNRLQNIRILKSAA
jgi:hypothetical protein